MANKLQSPGAFLTHLLEKHNLNPFKMSKDIGLSQSAVRLIVLGETRISVPVALRLAKYFNTNPEYWLMMQMKWDIAEAGKDKELAMVLRGISKFTSKPSAAKKAAPKKASGKKPAGKKKAGKKTASKKPAGKKPAAKKTAGRKPAARKTAAKKTAGKKTAAKRPAARKPAAKTTAKRRSTRK